MIRVSLWTRAGNLVPKDIYSNVLKLASPVLKVEVESAQDGSQIVLNIGEQTFNQFLNWMYSGPHKVNFKPGRGGKHDILPQMLQLWLFGKAKDITNLCNAAIWLAACCGKKYDSLHISGRLDVLIAAYDNARGGQGLREFLMEVWAYEQRHHAENGAFAASSNRNWPDGFTESLVIALGRPRDGTYECPYDGFSILEYKYNRDTNPAVTEESTLGGKNEPILIEDD